MASLARLRRTLLLAVALTAATFVVSPGYASTGTCSDDGHACAVWYPSSDTFSLQDTSCDSDYVFLVYWTQAGSQTRAENHDGCGSSKTIHPQVSGSPQTISWYVCHNKNNWPDSCSNTITSSY